MSLFGNDETLSRMNDLIKIGEVSSINPSKCTARVVFADDDGLVSYDLPILQKNTFKSSDYWMPVVGEDVLCLFLPSGVEEGFILGSFYAGEITPPESTEKRRTVVFEDGSIVRYDMASHTLTAQIEGTSIVADRSSVSVKAPDVINKQSTVVNISGSAQVNVEGGSAINLSAPVVTLAMGGATMMLNGASATLDVAQVNMTGDLIVDGDVIAGGVSLQNHRHTGDSGGMTSKPQ